MPNYQNLNPPIALASGDVGFSFNNEAFPGSAQAGSQFALLSYAGTPDRGTTVRWHSYRNQPLRSPSERRRTAPHP